MLRNGMRLVVAGVNRLQAGLLATNTKVPWQIASGTISCQRKSRGYSSTTDSNPHKFDKNVIDRTRLATYEEIVDIANHPEVLLVDVREPSELSATGQIPTSINIPLKQVSTELQLSPAAFESRYGRKKPAADDPIIFYCRIGVRSGNAANEADKLGFKRVKNYVGSWLEYAEKQGGSQGNDGVAPNTDNCGGNKFAPACIAPQLVANYDEIVDLPNHPEKLLIDVREPTELAATGRIPTSINIPLKTVRSELTLNPEAFEAKYGRKKPAAEDPIIFSCRSGVRAGQAAFEADQLGFQNVKNYVGSWQEWGPRHGLPVN